MGARNIKNIIFDLGGVIINLDINKTAAEFNKIGSTPFDTLYTQAKQTKLFDQFEKGAISPKEFLNEIKKEIRYTGNDQALLYAWNAMLLDVPEERLDLLVEAKQNYNTFLLSNTNELHITTIEHNLYHVHGVKNFEDYFDTVYYSCRVGMKKPDKQIFELVLKENNLNPAETVFIDDSIQHIQGAGACGINAYLLPKNMEVADLLQELNLL